MDSKKHIGMDVHQATISVLVMDSAGKVVMHSVIETKAAPAGVHPGSTRDALGNSGAPTSGGRLLANNQTPAMKYGGRDSRLT